MVLRSSSSLWPVTIFPLFLSKARFFTYWAVPQLIALVRAPGSVTSFLAFSSAFYLSRLACLSYFFDQNATYFTSIRTSWVLPDAVFLALGWMVFDHCLDFDLNLLLASALQT